MTDRAAPRATYRLQLHPGFDLDRAAALVDYLAALGVSHLYASPYLTAVPGSTHGYDVVDPTRVSPELGGADAHARLVGALSRAGLGQVLDIVPNHMAATRDNPWWWDLLENGPASVYAAFFDVDWDSAEARFRGLVLLPVLADHYGRILEAGELALERDGGRFMVRYHERAWPLSPESVANLLQPLAAAAGSAALADVATGLGELPASTDPALRARRARRLESLRRTLEWTLDEEPETQAAVAAALDATNHDADALDRILEAQHYRLACWRAAARDLDYRRFFDVDSLVGVRIEDPEVFAATHVRILDWLRDGVLDGVRVDHPDGLRRPREYLDRLRAAAPRAWIVVEKILEVGEALRDEWPVDGTTGYAFLNEVGGLFVDPAGERPLTEAYHAFVGGGPPWETLVYARRHQILREVLAADLVRLADHGVRVCEGRRRFRDFTRLDVSEALAETLACFPVYRSYVEEDGRATEEDRRLIRTTVDEARERRPDLAAELFDLVEAVLIGEADGPAERELRMRFQQLSGPVMAKAVEDTAYYAYGRLVALNEVGGDPGRFGIAPEAFHASRAHAAERWPATMLALSTHDTKRSEDVRARLFLLSEIPERWSDVAGRWSRANAARRDACGFGDPEMEYLLYQTLVGAWPLSADRGVAYMLKAAREAKTQTSWTAPVEGYEAALEAFVRGVLEDSAFIAGVEAFVSPLADAGRTNALAQKLIQLTSPGVPDLYQGTELWDLSLVDPDNRRAVDFELRRELLGELTRGAASDGPAAAARAALERAAEGAPKLWLVQRALQLRCRRPTAFAPGANYRPLAPSGEAARHLVAFARGDDVITAVPRLVLGLERRGGWADTRLRLPPGRWRDAFVGTGVEGDVPVATLLERFPVALLERCEE